MHTNSRLLQVSALALLVLAGSAALLWRFVLFPPIHPEFTQALFEQRFADGDRAASMRFPARSNVAVADMLAPLHMGLIAHGRRITGATLD